MGNPTSDPQNQKLYTVWNSTIKRKAPAFKQRQPIKKSDKPIARNKRPNPVSKKRAADNRIYAVENPIFLRNNPLCRANISEGCTKEHPRPSTQVHHLYSGRNRSKYYLDQSTWMPICDECHHPVHNIISAEKAVSLGVKLSE